MNIGRSTVATTGAASTGCRASFSAMRREGSAAISRAYVASAVSSGNRSPCAQASSCISSLLVATSVRLAPPHFENVNQRSEEHTSELQSLMRISYAVFCLKKNKTHNTHHSHMILIKRK